uniref:Synaptotagmin 6 n=1 Tax=Gopherus evgoodei TaxID=1825980 RepID=A0A8C4XYB7_9SAUR
PVTRRTAGARGRDKPLSISLLAVIVIVCGLALVAVFLFLFWKLCWVPWRNKAISSNVSQSEAACNQETMAGKLKDTGTLGFLEAAVKISHTSPDIPAEVQMSMKDHITRHVRLQRQTTEPASSTRHISFKRHLPRQMHVSSMDYANEHRKDLNQTQVPDTSPQEDSDPTLMSPSTSCAYEELTSRKLHLSVFDFDRFSRHDMIGEVTWRTCLRPRTFPGKPSIWKDIQYATNCEYLVDLGEIMFSLCYLPTAGRLTLTVIKCRNLKAMDITGYSDPYVKVSLLCDGRRLKKKKTTIKKNTLNPTYNEAIIFDIPPENMDQVSLLISVMDYDRVGHNEIIGGCRVGINAEGLGRDHWNEMLAYPRKPIAHWHPLMEVKKSFKEVTLPNG